MTEKMSFYKVFKEIHNKYPNWGYYHRIKDLDFDDIVDNPVDFIRMYLSLGDKLPTNLQDEFNNLVTPYRAKHMVTMYFTGIYIYKNYKHLKGFIDNYLEKVRIRILAESEIPIEKWNPATFEYYWFLICFFHDFALEASEKHNALDRLGVTELDFQSINIAIPYDSEVIPTVLYENCMNYYSYRYKGAREYYDHGILGGVFYYQNRKNQYEERISSTKKSIHRFSNKEILDSDKNLIWSEFLLKYIHSDIAWIIAAHNMWFCKKNSDRSEEYIKFNLGDLIIEKPIYLSEEYPLFFLLLFVDTLDVFKYLSSKVRELTYSEYLHKVDIRNENRVIKINFLDDFSKYAEEFYTKMKSEEYWLPIHISKNKNIIELAI